MKKSKRKTKPMNDTKKRLEASSSRNPRESVQESVVDPSQVGTIPLPGIPNVLLGVGDVPLKNGENGKTGELPATGLSGAVRGTGNSPGPDGATKRGRKKQKGLPRSGLSAARRSVPKNYHR